METLLLPMNDAERPEQRSVGDANGYQAALFDIFPHGAKRHDTDADVVDHGFLDHLNVVEVQRDVDFHAVVPQETVQMPADRKIVVESDEIDAAQFLRRDGSAAL